MDNQQSSYLELDLVWKKMAEEKFSTNKLKKQEIMDAIKSNSNSTIQKLKKRLKTKLLYSFVPLLLLLISLPSPWIKPAELWFFISLGVVLVLSMVFLYYKYRQMDDGLNESVSVLENLRHNAEVIRNTLFIERLWGIIGGTAVFIYSIFTSSSYGTNTISFIFSTCIIALIIIGLTFWTEVSNKKKFGVELKEMEDNIIRLETIG